jgi:cyanophycinase
VAVIVVPGGRAAADDELASLATADLQASVPGTLFICGGGRIPEPAVKKFVECAGGPSAHIVVVTTASETADTPDVEPRLEPWRRLTSIAELTILHTRSREIADDPEFTRPLASATGVWFIGGHQERLTDAYLGTRA